MSSVPDPRASPTSPPRKLRPLTTCSPPPPPPSSTSEKPLLVDLQAGEPGFPGHARAGRSAREHLPVPAGARAASPSGGLLMGALLSPSELWRAGLTRPSGAGRRLSPRAPGCRLTSPGPSFGSGTPAPADSGSPETPVPPGKPGSFPEFPFPVPPALPPAPRARSTEPVRPPLLACRGRHAPDRAPSADVERESEPGAGGKSEGVRGGGAGRKPRAASGGARHFCARARREVGGGGKRRAARTPAHALWRRACAGAPEPGDLCREALPSLWSAGRVPGSLGRARRVARAGVLPSQLTAGRKVCAPRRGAREVAAGRRRVLGNLARAAGVEQPWGGPRVIQPGAQATGRGGEQTWESPGRTFPQPNR